MAFEHQLLTESFSVLILLIIVALLLGIMRAFRWKHFFAVSLLSIFVVFLRPSYILLPIVTLAIIWWRYQKQYILVACISFAILYGSVLFMYAQTNYIHSQYRGISRISDVNLLGKILTLQLPADGIHEGGAVPAIIAEYRKYNTDTNPWSVFRAYPSLYRNEYAKPLHEYVQAVVRHNAFAYVRSATSQIPQSLVDISEENNIVYSTHALERLFYVLDVIYYYAQYINLIVLVAAPWYIIVGLIRRRHPMHTGYLALSIIALYHIAFAVYLGYSDFARHLSVVQPIVYFLSFSFIADVARRVNTHT